MPITNALITIQFQITISLNGNRHMQYFVKRGDKVHGPFSKSQLESGLKSKKLSKTDLISKDRSGPWEIIKLESESKAVPVDTSPIAQSSVQEEREPSVVTTNKAESELKSCQFCGEDVKLAAIKCKHCGSMLDSSDGTTETSKSASESTLWENNVLLIKNKLINVKVKLLVTTKKLTFKDVSVLGGVAGEPRLTIFAGDIKSVEACKLKFLDSGVRIVTRQGAEYTVEAFPKKKRDLLLEKLNSLSGHSA